MGTNTKFNVSVLALIMHGKQIMDEVGKKININTFDDHCISWANNFVTAIAYTPARSAPLRSTLAASLSTHLCVAFTVATATACSENCLCVTALFNH